MCKVKTYLLSFFLAITSSIPLGTLAQDRWPMREKSGSCPVDSTCRIGWQKPNNASGIGGFYINITSPNSAALVTFAAKKCDGTLVEDKGGLRFVTDKTTNYNYVDLPPNTCRVLVTIFKTRRDTGGDVEFVYNFDVDY
ncbi:hypothetical protein [Aerosakkonema funiforme]|uniref:hypothetical protein n=1 Tax=Aerosakkonema funiforme TaxID=1246630 RepID=UPI0035BA0BF4